MSIQAPVQLNLPSFQGPYVHPGLPKVKRMEITEERRQKIDEALAFLAALDPSQSKIKNNVLCISPPCGGQSSVFNLLTYMINKPFEIFTRAFLCCFLSDDRIKPLPAEAAETLSGTREQFERNVCGVCCIAPAVIIGTPFIPASKLVAKLLTILSGLVITTTAGTNTYVFSGNIGVVSNGRNNLVVQGGIQVDAISCVKNAYVQISDHLTEKWKTANHEDKPIIVAQCKKIINNWDYIFDLILDCGLKVAAVEDILAPFSTAITSILDEYEEDQRLNEPSHRFSNLELKNESENDGLPHLRHSSKHEALEKSKLETESKEKLKGKVEIEAIKSN